MWDRIAQLTAPAVEPLSLAEVKAHCRVDASHEDDFLTRAIRAARQLLEGPHGAGLALVAAEWQLRLDAFPAEIWVPMGPVLSIDAIEYLGAGGALQTVAPERYQWRQGTYEARIKPLPALSWPVQAHGRYDSVRVTFTAGFPGTQENPPNLAAIPEPLLKAMLMLVSHWNEHRETAVIGQVPAEVQFGFNDLVNRARVGRFA